MNMIKNIFVNAWNTNIQTELYVMQIFVFIIQNFFFCRTFEMRYQLINLRLSII
jgi:hypothetical protein